MRTLILPAIFLLLSACSSNENRPVTAAMNPLTQGNVSMNLRVGETTQADVLEVFGAPNVSTIDANGQEVWSYQRHATVTQASTTSNYWTVILGGSQGSSANLESSQRTMTLIIRFDDRDVVSDFRSRASEF